MALKNNCIFIGRTGQDPTIREFQDGNKVGNVSLAVDNSYINRHSGERIERTIWITLIIPNFLCDAFKKHIPKGSKIGVETSYEVRQWQNKEGHNRYSHEFHVKSVEFLDIKKHDNQNREAELPAPETYSEDSYDGAKLDDDLPF